jgi:hypothetical protein
MIRARSAIVPSGVASGAGAGGRETPTGCRGSGGRVDASGGGWGDIAAVSDRRFQCIRPAAKPITIAAATAAMTARVDTTEIQCRKGGWARAGDDLSGAGTGTEAC